MSKKAIIVEGPDGSGKTTLIGKMTKYFGLDRGIRFSDSLTGPLDNLGQRVIDDYASWGDSPKVYDRHPLVSEYCYGPLLRGGADPSLDQIPEEIVQGIRSDALLILCLPSYYTVADSVSKEAQMPGVRSNLTDIYQWYEKNELIDSYDWIHIYDRDGGRQDLNETYDAIDHYLRKNN